MDGEEVERLTGARLTFSALPTCRENLDRFHAPLGLLFTPLRALDPPAPLCPPPPRCAGCSTFFNAFCTPRERGWECSVCQRGNQWMGETAEGHSVVEFEMADGRSVPPTDFLFLVDLCQSEQNLIALKRELKRSAERLGVGGQIRFALIAFARNVFVFLNRSTRIPHCVCLPSNADIGDLPRLLGVGEERPIEPRIFFDEPNAFTAAIDALTTDPWPTPAARRPMRASGKAIEVALSLVELYRPRNGARVVLFAAGPCTISPGAVAEIDATTFLRRQTDLEATGRPRQLVEGAQTFYNGLADKAVSLQTAIDVFAFSLEEFGLFEMQRLVTRTSGLVLMNEEFKQSHFAACWQRYFRLGAGQCDLGFGGTVEILFSRELRVQGCVGLCASVENKSNLQAARETGECQTNIWAVAGLDPQLTLLFVLDLAQQTGTAVRPEAYIQLIVGYKPTEGRARRRVVTLRVPFLGSASAVAALQSVDQFALTAAYAKLAAHRFSESREGVFSRFLDRTLITVLRTLGRESVPSELNLLPQYFYYFRRSVLGGRTASSLDELAFYRYALLRENVENILLMLQPQILQYSLESAEPTAVLPDIDCLGKEVVLLADTFFYVIVWRGASVEAWLQQGYHCQPEYAHIGRLIEAPECEATRLAEDRVLAPDRVVTYAGAPAERLLKSRLNPENKTVNSSNEAVDSGDFISDDGTLSAFVARLLQLLARK